MESVKGYLLSVICGAIVCALVGSLTDRKGSAGVLLKLISGVFLIFTVISPIRTLPLEELSLVTEHIRQDAVSASALGQAYSKESMASYIKAETEAYILDKATGLHTSITAEVFLNDQLQPESVLITGPVSDYARFRLETILEADLGIAKENQQWKE